MNINRAVELEAQIIINKNLYEKKIIDYKTYQAVFNHILNKLNQLKDIANA